MEPEIQTIVGNTDPILPEGVVKTKNGAFYDTAKNKFVPNPNKEKTATFTSPADPAEKKRGRPALPRDKNGNVIRPESSVKAEPAKDALGDVPRKKKSDSKRTEYTTSQIDLLAKQTVGVHAMLALMTGMPELQINETEGAILARAISAVASEYGVAVSGKAAAGMQMLAACAMVYAPRAIKIAQRVNSEKIASSNRPKVTPIRPNMNQDARVNAQPGPVELAPHEMPADLVSENEAPIDQLIQ
jgi:hypothetical protein